MATLAQAATELANLHGLDLEPEERLALLREGYIEWCVRSEWTQATLSIGPTVADQAAYTMPASVSHPLKLWVEGVPFKPTSPEVVAEIAAGDLNLARGVHGLWWLSHDASGVEKFSLYPTPGVAGLSITTLCVVYPADLDEGDEFAIPRQFHRAPIHYTRMVSLGSSEDDLDGEGTAEQKFELYVSRGRRLRRSRTGRGPVDMRIVGVSA